MNPRIIVFFSTKGGVGTTLLSANIGVALSQEGKKTLLVDFDLGAPLSMAKMINAKPKYSLFDAASAWDKIDKGRVSAEQFIGNYSSNLDFLTAITKIRQIPHIRPELIDLLFKKITPNYDFIVLDAGKDFSDNLIKILDNANLLLQVVTPDILSVYQTEWALDTLQTLHFPLEMIKIILNRSESKGGVSWQEVKVVLPCDIIGRIPSEGKAVGLSLNKGVPVVVDNPKCKFSQDIKTVARTLIDTPGLYISDKRLADLRVRDRVGVSSGDFWVKEGLVEPLGEGEFEEEDEIITLKRKVHSKLIERMDLKQLTKEITRRDFEKTKELREKAEKIITNLLTEESGGSLSSFEVRKKLTREIVDEAFGLGPLEDLINDPEITEIMVNNKDQVFVEKDGRIRLTTKKFTSDDQVRVVIERIIAPLGRRIDESVPMVDARLPDGSRVNAIIPPLSLRGPSLTIRKFARKKFTMQDLIERFGSISEPMAHFLQAAVEARKNMLISGGTGSGKTTFLNILSAVIPEAERILTIEDAAELKLRQSHWIRLESRPPNIEGKGEITTKDLFRNSLRMRPDRIIVGEVRGREVLDMLQAMNTGHDGSLSTIHANSTRDVLIRLDSMILMAGIELPIRAIREMIASALDLIVHTARLSDGSRKVVQISEVAGMLDETHIKLQDIFIFKQVGVDEQKRVKGNFSATGYIPSFYDEMIARGLNVPKEIFTPRQ